MFGIRIIISTFQIAFHRSCYDKNGNIIPVNFTEVLERVEVKLLSFVTSAIDLSGQIHALARGAI